MGEHAEDAVDQAVDAWLNDDCQCGHPRKAHTTRGCNSRVIADYDRLHDEPIWGECACTGFADYEGPDEPDYWPEP